MALGLDHLAVELADAELGDARLSRRLALIVGAVARRPGQSLPKALVSGAALEATYRFMSNEAVTPERILAPHIAATCERAATAACVLAIHDTTECEFGGEQQREGLGRLTENRQGFRAHVCLAVNADDGHPLGILDAHTWIRTSAPPGRKKRATYEYKTRASKESDRWCEMTERVEVLTREHARVIHVMDREADFYRLEAQLVHAGAEFVIRGSHMERVLADGRTLEHATSKLPIRLAREVALSKRPPPTNKNTSHPQRRARNADLVVGATTVTMKRSWATPEGSGPDFQLNVVHVSEKSPPDGEPPVEWTLLTTLPTATADQIEFVVDTYRRRWMIEELFKALKSGCQFEKLQLETAPALLNAFAVMLPVAAALLALRHIARSHPDARANTVLTSLQLKILGAHKHTRELPIKTVTDALLAVARLGGHIKNNGDPGWIVLGRGYEELLSLEEGASLALEM